MNEGYPSERNTMLLPGSRGILKTKTEVTQTYNRLDQSSFPAFPVRSLKDGGGGVYSFRTCHELISFFQKLMMLYSTPIFPPESSLLYSKQVIFEILLNSTHKSPREAPYTKKKKKKKKKKHQVGLKLLKNYGLRSWYYTIQYRTTRQGRRQPHSPGWARVPLSSFFPQISINFSYFSSGA